LDAKLFCFWGFLHMILQTFSSLFSFIKLKSLGLNSI
jgi:hypothetical protein